MSVKTFVYPTVIFLFFFKIQAAVIEGTIIDIDNTLPVPGVVITLHSAQIKKDTVSDLNGLFSFPELTPGEYFLSISGTGFKSLQSKVIKITSNDSAITNTYTIESVSEGNANISMRPSDKMRQATIIDQKTSLPIAGIQTSVNRTLFVTSNNSGIITIPDSLSGTLTLTFSGTGYIEKKESLNASDFHGRQFTLTPISGTTGPITPVDYNIKGTVYDSIGQHPLTGARITIHGTDRVQYSDNNGRYFLYVKNSGHYSLICDYPGYDTLKKDIVLDNTTTVYDLEIQMSPFKQNSEKTIRGIIRDKKSSNAVANVQIINQTLNTIVLTDSTGSFSSTTTDSSNSLIFLKKGYNPIYMEPVTSDTFLTVYLQEDTSGAVDSLMSSLLTLSHAATRSTLFSGSVLENGTEFPIQNASITLDTSTILSGFDGGFSIDISDTGTVRAIIKAPDYDSQTVTVNLSADSKPLRVYLTPRASGKIASSARVFGKVVDSKTGAALIGARIMLENSRYESVSDLDGNFRISDVKSGTYTILAFQKDYATVKKAHVIIEKGKTVRNDIMMSPDSASEMQRITVASTAIKSSDASLLRDRKMSFGINDGISSDVISKGGSGNAADAVKKVTGVTIVDGKYVYIRGMGERYVNVTLNDQAVPSPDPDKRSIPLDIFPTGLIENISMNKAFTPDLPGDFAGGSVNIKTKSIPDKFQFTLSAKGGANSNVTGKNILTYEGGKYDWLGFDDGTRDMPDELKDGTVFIPNYTVASNDTTLVKELDTLSKSFNNNYTLVTNKGIPDFGGGISIGNSFQLNDGSIGGLLNLTYSRSTKFYENGINARYIATGNADISTLLDTDDGQYRTDSKSTTEILWGGLGTFGLKLGDNHTFNSTIMYVRNAEDVARRLYGDITKLNYPSETRNLEFSERNLLDVMFDGEHKLTTSFPSQINWRGSISKTMQNQPDQRFILIENQEDNDSIIYAFPGTQQAPSRYYRRLDETSTQLYCDYTVHFDSYDKENLILKTGAAYQDKSRKYNENYFTFSSKSVESSINRFQGNTDDYFTRKNAGLLSDTTIINYNRRTRQWDTLHTYTWGVVVESMPLDADYTAHRIIPALYALLSVKPFINEIKLTGGLRYEYTFLDLEMQAIDSLNVKKRIGDYLPAVNATFSPLKDMNIRAVYGKTVARPVERELAPKSTFDAANNSPYVGNADLNRTIIYNYDLRWEYFQYHNDIVAASLFYKHLKYPIELVILNNNGTIQHQNVSKGTLYGAELELRYSLERFSPGLKGFQLGTNLTIARSEVLLGKDELANKRNWNRNYPASRPLQGQSPYVVNFDISYENEKLGLNLGTFFNVFGPRLAAVSKNQAPDVYEQPSPLLDFAAEKKFHSNYSLKLGAKNLLADIFDADNEKIYTYKGKRYYYSHNSKGMSFSVNIGYSIK